MERAAYLLLMPGKEAAAQVCQPSRAALGAALMSKLAREVLEIQRQPTAPHHAGHSLQERREVENPDCIIREHSQALWGSEGQRRPPHLR